MFLLDTNVVSELRRPKPHGAVTAWLQSVRDARLCLSVMTVGALQAGIERTRAHNPEKAIQIEQWVDSAIQAFDVIAVDSAVIRLWARLIRGRKSDQFEDVIIAATAITRGLTLVTRNTRDFESFYVKIVNPFA